MLSGEYNLKACANEFIITILNLNAKVNKVSTKSIDG